MTKRVILMLFGLLMISNAHAELYDIAGKQFLMQGAAKATFIVKCGPLAVVADRMEFLNTFSIKFDALDEAGGTFQIFDDDLVSTGTPMDGEIIERKKNRLRLQYAGMGSPLDNGENLKDMLIEKAAQKGVQLSPDTKVVSYSFTGKIKAYGLNLNEKVGIIIPDYPKNNCSTRVNVRRKLIGYP